MITRYLYPVISLFFFQVFHGCKDDSKTIDWVYPDGNHKAFVISIDDGSIEDIQLAKMFEENGIVGTFNLNSGLFGTTHLLNERTGKIVYQNTIPKDSVVQVYKNHEIGAHGRYHKNFFLLTDDQIREEVQSNIADLEQLTHRKIKSMAYPFGNTNKHIAKVVSKTGLTNGRTVYNAYTFDLPIKKNYFLWNPTCHFNQAPKYLNKFLALNNHKLSLFCVFGHAWELNTVEKWEHIDTFCKAVGNRKDIWYTGSEAFIDYLKALRTLKKENGQITNPKDNQSVWYVENGHLKELLPGKSIGGIESPPKKN